MREIPAGRRCFDGRSDKKCCTFYRPDGFCDEFNGFTDKKGRKRKDCIVAYPYGGIMMVLARTKS